LDETGKEEIHIISEYENEVPVESLIIDEEYILRYNDVKSVDIWLTFNRICCDIFQKTELFITTGVKTSNPT
jgi:hypothetical protein